MPKLLVTLVAGTTLAGFAANVPKPAPSKPVDYQKEVRPILSNNCYQCHGPDKGTRMANLRLDTKEGAFAPRKTGAAIVPGNPQGSIAVQRVFDEKAARRMPPVYSHKTLTDEQKETLRRWVQQGAPWKEHWAFTAPVRPALPIVAQKAWIRNPIDRFLLAKMEAAGLKPAPEADRRTLARRVALDLTGLPPTPEEVEAFEKDKAPNAYEKLVAKYLDSPRWGEHRARYWLDAARYADTHGIHVDNYREMWPYRDWVIQAFNRNLSFDRFTTEQLAGDLLPNGTLDQKVASGFQRCNATTNEAGVIIEEIEAMYAKDRADTVGAVWLGMTVGCATCHDHKFDPIKQKDFYALTAFFRNTTQHAMDDNIPDTPPILIVPAEEDRPRWDEIRRQETEIQQKLVALRQGGAAPYSAWLQSGAHQKIPAPLPVKSEMLALDLSTGPAVRKDGESIKLSLAGGAAVGDASTPQRKALYFDKKAFVELPAPEWVEADKPFSVSTWFYFPTGEESFVIASQNIPQEKGRGWVLSIGARVPSFRLTGDDGRGITITAGHLEQVRPGTWNHLVVSYDGSREQAGMGMYLNGRPVSAQGAGDQNTKLAGCLAESAPVLLAKDGGRGLPGGSIGDFRIYNRVVTEQEAYLASLWPLLDRARDKAPAALSGEEREALELYFASNQNPEYRSLLAQLPVLKAERREIRRRGAITHVMNERTDQKPFAHVLFRGMYDQPRERVQPDTPSALPAMAASYPRDRMGLAQWLMDPANPMTARVTVNRFWQEVFGTGLVKTAEDFGSQGEPPSHPELLDWLAVEFRESGWDIKKFYTLMVTSAAYRQSALATEEKVKKDPENRLLARGPRFRMDGEMVRDYALAVSGLLSQQIGGPSVKPYQPEGVWETVAMLGSNTRFYQADKGDSLYRRSLYTFWKRSAPPPSLEIFNAPTRENCTVRRERTNTPLQALVTLNDVQYVEAARHLAERAMVQGGTEFDRQLDYMTGHTLARGFDAVERETARRAYRDFMKHYDTHPADAKKLLAMGESPRNEKLDPTVHASLTLLANEILNLDEALNK